MGPRPSLQRFLWALPQNGPTPYDPAWDPEEVGPPLCALATCTPAHQQSWGAWASEPNRPEPKAQPFFVPTV